MQKISETIKSVLFIQHCQPIKRWWVLCLQNPLSHLDNLTLSPSLKSLIPVPSHSLPPFLFFTLLHRHRQLYSPWITKQQKKLPVFLIIRVTISFLISLSINISRPALPSSSISFTQISRWPAHHHSLKLLFYSSYFLCTSSMEVMFLPTLVYLLINCLKL